MGNLSIRSRNQKPGSDIRSPLPGCSSASMSFSRLFLGGLVSTRTHLRFTGRHQNAIKWFLSSRLLQRTANRVLSFCLTQGVNPPGERTHQSAEDTQATDVWPSRI